MTRRRQMMLKKSGGGLPDGFTAVDYLESTGTQYIDTEISAAIDLGVKINFMPKSSGQAFGAITSLRKGYYGVEFSPSRGITAYWGAGGIDIRKNWEAGATYEIDFNYQNSGIAIFNDATLALPSNGEITQNTVHLFKLNEGTTPYTQYISGQAYGMKMTKGHEIVLDFLPALNPDGVPCMYDVIRKKAFYNAGTGDFLWG